LRKVPEWRGRTDDTPIPDTVRLRIWMRSKGMCGICGGAVFASSGDLEFDHITALCNGGEHREGNIQAVHVYCHSEKTKTDLHAHARTMRKRRRYLLGKKPSRHPLPGSRNSPWKRTFSRGWVRR
jgi:5-methylcytosine-specific restriction endonuclease McrA